MAEKDDIRESLDALRKFERNNPKIFRADNGVRFSARITWEIFNEEPQVEDDVYAGWNQDGSGRISLEQPDGVGGWEVYWRFYADISHYYLYDDTANALRVMDSRRYMEITIEPDISVLELIAIQDNVN